MSDKEIRPFRIAVPQSDLDDLHDRLDRAHWPDELPDVGWEYGVAEGHLRDRLIVRRQLPGLQARHRYRRGTGRDGRRRTAHRLRGRHRS